MTYTAQQLFDYAQDNGLVLDTHEIFEAMDRYPNNIMDAFDYAILSGDFSDEDIDLILSTPNLRDL